METSVIVPSHPMNNEKDETPSGVASNEEDPCEIDIIDKNSYEDAVNTDDEFVDDYSHTEPNVFYTTHNIPGPGIDVELFYSQISRRCNCSINETKSDEKDLKPEIIKNGIGQLIETKSSHGNYVSMNREIVDGSIDNQNKLCAENCQCNLGPNYNNRKLNIDIYKLPIYECNNFCGCQKINTYGGKRKHQRCSNRVIQKGPNKNLVIFHHAKIAKKGYGVKASKAINQGEFICEYVGEVIDKVEAKRRYAIYKEQNFQRHQQILKQDEESPTEYNEKPQKEPEMKINSCNFYIFNLNEIVDHSEASISSNPKNLSLDTQNSTKKSNKKDSVSSISEITSNSTSLSTSLVSEGSSSNDDVKPNLLNTYNQFRSNEFSSTFEMFIDATAFGNIARYINHSCDPNCVVLPVRINSIYPSLAIFAKRDIERGEELGYDYAGMDDAERSLDESILGERESVLEKINRHVERPNTKFRYIDERKVTNVNERRNTEMDEASEEVKAEINVSGRKSVSDTGVDNINKNSTTQIKGLSNTEIDKSTSSEDVKDEINISERKLRGSNEKYYQEVTYVSGSSTSTSQVEELDTNRTSKDILLKLVSDINDEVKNPNEKDLTPCHCGSKKCRKFLPYSPLQ